MGKDAFAMVTKDTTFRPEQYENANDWLKVGYLQKSTLFIISRDVHMCDTRPCKNGKRDDKNIISFLVTLYS